MFHRILIANRGEIAVRIIRSCREMEIETVAVYSTADADALHVKLATRAVCIGPAKAGESYLNMSAILTAALETGCDAIHPGYGFLSENAEFADLCQQCGLKFIGPSGDVIRKMGNKPHMIQVQPVGQWAGRRVPVVLGGVQHGSIPRTDGTLLPPRSTEAGSGGPSPAMRLFPGTSSRSVRPSPALPRGSLCLGLQSNAPALPHRPLPPGEPGALRCAAAAGPLHRGRGHAHRGVSAPDEGAGSGVGEGHAPPSTQASQHHTHRGGNGPGSCPGSDPGGTEPGRRRRHRRGSWLSWRTSTLD